MNVSLWFGVWFVLFCAVSLLWVVQRFTHNAAIIDVGWAGGVALAAVIFALQGHGAPEQRWLAGACAVLWGLRLALYVLFTRVIGQPEEGRYRQLRIDWAPHFQSKLFGFFQLQALLAVVFSLPFALMAQETASGYSLWQTAAIVVWALALAGETLADAQLYRFKLNPQNKGKVCRVGLWRYSRHPNYFFEWLLWWSVAVMAGSAPWGVLALLCPLLISVFLFKMTGIPATEAQAVRSKGEAYREYQRTTSVFVPWFPKEGKDVVV